MGKMGVGPCTSRFTGTPSRTETPISPPLARPGMKVTVTFAARGAQWEQMNTAGI